MTASRQELLDRRLRITEIFYSIQGESTWMGLPCLFIRLTGCNLRCLWCDSAYAFAGGEWMTIAEILERGARLGAWKLVEITGGEPLLQPEVHGLMTALCDAGKTVLLETSGSLDVAAVDPRVVKIIDLKAPGSGEVGRNRWDVLEHLQEHDEIKIVIRDREDYVWARDVILNHGLPGRIRQVLLSPVFADCHPRALAEWILADHLPVRMQLQLHKFIWDPDTKGV